MKEYDVFIPLTYNDGSLIEPKRLEEIHQLLLGRFDGLTFFPQPNQGYWNMSGIMYHDEIVVYRVLTENTTSARRFFKKFKEKLKTDLRQEEILIIERDVRTI